jgi:PDZ domain-containing protein/aspartyl protease
VWSSSPPPIVALVADYAESLGLDPPLRGHNIVLGSGLLISTPTSRLIETRRTTPCSSSCQGELLEHLGQAARAGMIASLLLAGCRPGRPIAPPVPLTTVPFDSYGGAIHVPAVINGDSVWLILDTGLSRTGLDHDWASTSLMPIVETESTGVVTSLRLGGLEIPNHPVVLYRLGALSAASGRPERGLLGNDVLHRFTVEIDYQLQRLRLYDASHYDYRGRGAPVLFTPDADVPLLSATVKVPGRRPVAARLLLDTGASGLCIIFSAPFGEDQGLALLRPAIVAPIGTGLAGDLHGVIVRLQEVRLGRIRIASPTSAVGTEQKGFLGRTDIDGVVGNSVFEGSRLIVDYARHRAIVERSVRGEGSGRCDFDMSGLRLVARGTGLREFVVDYVIPHSPAADAGIVVGDELLSIDGRPVSALTLSDVRKAFSVEDAERLLTLRRDTATLRVVLKLRRLL